MLHYQLLLVLNIFNTFHYVDSAFPFFKNNIAKDNDKY